MARNEASDESLGGDDGRSGDTEPHPVTLGDGGDPVVDRPRGDGGLDAQQLRARFGAARSDPASAPPTNESDVAAAARMAGEAHYNAFVVGEDLNRFAWITMAALLVVMFAVAVVLRKVRRLEGEHDSAADSPRRKLTRRPRITRDES
jgi:hypothetical protein